MSSPDPRLTKKQLRAELLARRESLRSLPVTWAIGPEGDFSPDELATPNAPWLDLEVDPKLAWALRHMDRFPVEVMSAPLEELLRVPGVGPVGARRIIAARRTGTLTFDDLARLKVTLKRARHFLTVAGQRDANCPLDAELIRGKYLGKSFPVRRTRQSVRMK